MAVFLQPLLIAALLWWVSTGAILWLVRRPRATFGWSLGLSAGLAAAATVGVMITARDPGVTSAYLAFGCALTVWGWHEMGFLMGKLTGPRRTACPFGAQGWKRFTLSAETVIHHEIALALTALLFVALTWDQPNQTGTLTFLLLLGMRLSTKLNIFLGVPNPPIAFLPAGLKYLQSYFRRARFNALFPLSLAVAIVVTLMLGDAALASTGGTQVGYALMFMLAALGLLEHGFLMLPSPDRALWGWALEQTKPAVPVARPTAAEPINDHA
ncbi:hypothetical protein BZG35_15595 [Brevundimonas sp. LM2]|uniref:putative photosynthetic complex assembly protein PuhE n=1 Tax=Brevundimonas sp. LM2 TaxID=1938605 RepID=UPI0009838F8F|nr:putative photosynthetic complex assembly protein PuhE [Brevundimonas sp. LM2]AQR62918.1 hypothetical protein BZG35_15595 [Brevundimonas sp. LM2]